MRVDLVIDEYLLVHSFLQVVQFLHIFFQLLHLPLPFDVLLVDQLVDFGNVVVQCLFLLTHFLRVSLGLVELGFDVFKVFLNFFLAFLILLDLFLHILFVLHDDFELSIGLISLTLDVLDSFNNSCDFLSDRGEHGC